MHLCSACSSGELLMLVPCPPCLYCCTPCIPHHIPHSLAHCAAPACLLSSPFHCLVNTCLHSSQPCTVMIQHRQKTKIHVARRLNIGADEMGSNKRTEEEEVVIMSQTKPWLYCKHQCFYHPALIRLRPTAPSLPPALPSRPPPPQAAASRAPPGGPASNHQCPSASPKWAPPATHSVG